MKIFMIEGSDGCGKTTQVSLLKESLSQRGINAFYYREPGGTKFGEKIRKILLDPETGDLESMTEVMLFMASRIELYKEILNRHTENDVILFDRSYISTYVYQLYTGTMQDILANQFHKLIKQIVNHYLFGRNKIIYIRTPLHILNERRKSRNQSDRFEDKPESFHQKIFEVYEKMATLEEYDYMVNGDGSAEDIHNNILDIILRNL